MEMALIRLAALGTFSRREKGCVFLPLPLGEGGDALDDVIALWPPDRRRVRVVVNFVDV